MSRPTFHLHEITKKEKKYISTTEQHNISFT